MDWIAFAACQLLLVAVGYAVLCALLGGRSINLAMLLGLSWAGGAGAVPVLLFSTSLAGRAPDLLTLGCIGSITAGTIALFASRGRLIGVVLKRTGKFRHRTFVSVGLCAAAAALVVVAIANVAAQVRVPGLADVDAFAIWVMKAKVVASVPLRPIPVWLTDPTLSFSHQDYPLGVPLLTAAVHAATGWPIEICAVSMLLPTFVALVLLTFGGLCELLELPLALAVTAVFVSSPVLRSLAGSPVAELPLVLQHAASLWLLLVWMRTGRRGWVVGSAIFAAFAAFTKNEGLALLPVVGLAAIAFAVAERSWSKAIDLAWASVVSIAVLSPWLIYRRYLPHTHEDYGGRLSHVAAAIRHGDRWRVIAQQFLTQPLQVGSTGGLWILLLVCAALGYRAWRQPAVMILWLLLGAHVLLYVMVFLVTPWDLSALLGMVGPKLVMHVSPAAAMLIALHARSLPTTATDLSFRPQAD